MAPDAFFHAGVADDSVNMAIDLAMTFHVNPFDFLARPHHELAELHSYTLKYLESTRDD